MNTALPAAWAGTIAQLLEGVSRKDLAARAGNLSAAYRSGKGSGGVVGREDALAYLLARAPATFAATGAVFAQVVKVAPDFAPVSLLDVGAGPGTAAAAAKATWPSLGEIALLEANPAFRDLASLLMPSAKILASDMRAMKPNADLVMAAYVLAEVPENMAGEIARDLWASARQMLVLIEPGTPQGFARIRAARAVLIESGAHIAAPCTHDNKCPMSGSDWCHFSQRLARSRDHLILKDASVPFEDERYSYVVAMREPVASGARIITRPVETKPGITLPLCEANGLRDEFIPRRDKDAFRRARKLDWGDLINNLHGRA
jgi:ribosomal protein RSM22 (predicted rRNA methylase)